jgi:hypothetical protein
MTSDATFRPCLGFIVADLILQKGAKVRSNLRFRAKVRQDLYPRVGFGFGIFVAFGPHPQQ